MAASSKLPAKHPTRFLEKALIIRMMLAVQDSSVKPGRNLECGAGTGRSLVVTALLLPRSGFCAFDLLWCGQQA
jgi:hypothetical protein